MNEGPETAPLVSVVIPTFNRAQDLRRCLDSLVAQSFKKFEVLVCDDGSTDNSESVAQERTTAMRGAVGTGFTAGRRSPMASPSTAAASTSHVRGTPQN